MDKDKKDVLSIFHLNTNVYLMHKFIKIHFRTKVILVSNFILTSDVADMTIS